MAENAVCSICLQDIKQATMLECKHCFCLKCLTDYSSKFTYETAVPCPLCRKTIPMPECVVDKIEAQKSKHEIPQGCSICEGGVHADFRCTDCCQNMCQFCKRTHDNIMTCRSHNVVDVGSGEATGSTGGGVSVAPVPEPKDLCPFHESTGVGFYCKDCRVGICCRCFVTDHNGHLYVDVEKDVDFQNAKLELGTLEKEIENKITKFQEFCISLNTRISKIEEMAETECFKVDCHIEKICEKLRQHGEELKNNVNETRNKEKLKIETLLREVKLLNENLKTTNKDTGMVLEQNSVVQVLDLIPKVKMMKTKSESQNLEVPAMRYTRFIEGCEDLTSFYHQSGRTEDFPQKFNIVRIFNLGIIYNTALNCSFGASQYCDPSQGFSSTSVFGSPSRKRSKRNYMKSTCIEGPWKIYAESAESNLVISLCLLSIKDSDLESCDIEFYCKLQNKINDDISVIKRGEHSFRVGKSDFVMLVVDEMFDSQKGFTDANGDFTVNCSLWMTSKTLKK